MTLFVLSFVLLLLAVMTTSFSTPLKKPQEIIECSLVINKDAESRLLNVKNVDVGKDTGKRNITPGKTPRSTRKIGKRGRGNCESISICNLQAIVQSARENVQSTNRAPLVNITNASKTKVQVRKTTKNSISKKKAKQHRKHRQKGIDKQEKYPSNESTSFHDFLRNRVEATQSSGFETITYSNLISQERQAEEKTNINLSQGGKARAIDQKKQASLEEELEKSRQAHFVRLSNNTGASKNDLQTSSDYHSHTTMTLSELRRCNENTTIEEEVEKSRQAHSIRLRNDASAPNNPQTSSNFSHTTATLSELVSKVKATTEAAKAQNTTSAEARKATVMHRKKKKEVASRIRSRRKLLRESQSTRPLLDKLGFSSLIEREEKRALIADLLCELSSLQNEDTAVEEDNAAYFEFQTKNFNTRRAYFFSQCTHNDSFDAWNRNSQHVIESLASFIGKAGTTGVDNEPFGAQLLLDRLRKSFPKTFDSVAGSSKKFRRLNNHETAAILADTSVTDAALRTISQHCSAHFGEHLICPDTEMKKLTERRPELKFGDHLYYKPLTAEEKAKKKQDEKDGRKKEGEKETIKEPEKVQFAFYDGNQAVEMYLERQIEFDIWKKRHLNNADSDVDSSLPLYSYDIEYELLDSADGAQSKPTARGVYCFFGTDHGQGYSQTGVKMHLTGPEERRGSGCAEDGTITIPLMQIRCKKDPPEILKLTNNVVNDLIHSLNSCKIVAVKDSRDKVRCKLIPREATNFSCSDGRTLSYKIGPEHVTINLDDGLNDDQNSEFKCWTAVQNTKIKTINDLMAAFTIMGRHGHSTSKCLFCDLVKSEWVKKAREGKLLTTEDVKRAFQAFKASGKDADNPGNRLGVWDVPIEDFLPPPVHISIGAINDLRDAMIYFALCYLDDPGEAEEECLDLIDDILKKIDDLKAESEATDVSLATDREKRKTIKAQLMSVKKKVTTRLKKQGEIKNGKPETKRDKEMLDELPRLLEEDSTLSQQKIILDTAIDQNMNRKKEIASSLKDSKKQHTELKRKAKDFIKERKKLEGGADVEFDEILQSFHVIVKAWHGGSLTYRSGRTMMQKADKIMDEVKTKWLERFEARKVPSKISEEEVEQAVERYRDMLIVMDVMFNHIRIIKPTEQERNRIPRIQKVYGVLLSLLTLNETPKAHTNLAHMITSIIKHDGLGDKTEEWLEKLHQRMKRLLTLTSRMTCGWRLQMETIHKYLWRESDPFVQYTVKKVRETLKRKKVGECRQCTIKAESMEERRDSRWALFEEIEHKYSAELQRAANGQPPPPVNDKVNNADDVELDFNTSTLFSDMLEDLENYEKRLSDQCDYDFTLDDEYVI